MDIEDFSRQEAVHMETDKQVFEQMFAGTCWDGGTQRGLCFLGPTQLPTPGWCFL